jgi:hypothetical protein
MKLHIRDRLSYVGYIQRIRTYLIVGLCILLKPKPYKMKKLLFFAIASLLIAPQLNGQSIINVLTMQSVHYTYDEVGNRIEKSTLVLKSGSASSTPEDEIPVEDKTFEKFNVLIYPNPTDSQVSIEITGNDNTVSSGDIFQLAIYDLHGRVIQQQTMSAGGRTDLNLENKPDGLYLLIIRNEGTVSQWKIIKR